MDISVGPLREADVELAHTMGQWAFGHTRPFVREFVPALDAHVAVYDGDELVACSRIRHADGQYFGGRSVTSMGVSGVSVAPHRRGEGLANLMMQELVKQLHADGIAASSLYPTTAQLYRKVGYEVAGDYQQRTLPVHLLAGQRSGDCVVSMAPLGPAGDDIRAVYDTMARSCDGWMNRSDEWWHRLNIVRDRTATHYLPLLHRGGQPVAYALLQAVKENTDGAIMDLDIVDLAAVDGPAMRDLAAVIAGFGTVAGKVTTHLPVHHLGLLTEQAQLFNAGDRFPWMFRLVDAAAAIQQRGWPASVNVRVELAIDDPLLPSNAGPHVLEIADGQGTLTPAGAGGAAVSITHLAAWFTGWTPASTLAWQGLLAGLEAPQLTALDAAVAGPAPALSEFF